MTTTTDAAVADLRLIRESWGDLLAAIGRAPATEWPPRDSISALLAAPVEDESVDQTPAVGRLPLVLREHPAPVNLEALDAAVSIEVALFGLADHLAAVVQRPIRTVDVATYADPRRWQYQAPTSPGSRAFGLHWAAVWCEGRLLGEDDGDLFRPVPLRLVDEARGIIRHARAELERALHRDDVPTVLADPCPWCSGALTARTNSGDPAAAVITCGTGPDCTAPVLLDRGRRRWRGPDLVQLWGALDAARRRAPTG